MILTLLLACSPGGSKAQDRDCSPDGAADTESGAPDSAPDSAPPSETVLPEWAPTAAAPFVVESCGFDVAAGGPTVVPDLDADGVDDLLVVTDEPLVAGIWRVGSSDAPVPFWESPVRWDVLPAARGPGVRAWPDLDGDGLAELVAFTAADEGRGLLPGGDVSGVLVGAPVAVLPWHDVDGDSIDEHLAVYAEEGVLRVVTASGVDPAAWTIHTSLAVPGLGGYAARSRDDHDGDGVLDVFVDATGGGLLVSSAALDGASAAAVLSTFGGVGAPVPLGDVDGGGVEDVAFVEAPGDPGPVTLCRGEAPADVVSVPSDIPSAGSTVGPDGAGGLAVLVADGAVSRYPIAAAFDGTQRAEVASTGVLAAGGGVRVGDARLIVARVAAVA